MFPQATFPRIVVDNTDRFANGDLAELIIYDKPLSDSEMSIVESYLSQKWGIGGAPAPSSMITLTADSVQDEYGEGNDFAIALTEKNVSCHNSC